MYHYPNLNPQKALIWRIVHRDNIPWILDNGLHCGNSNARSPNWVSIGNEELIDKRSNHLVPRAPGGNLNDYVPFYFTPFSVMMMNIHSGRGVPQRRNEEIVILVSSLHDIHNGGLRYLFTDSHAYYMWANYYDNLGDLDRIDWPLLQRRDFKRDPNDPAKIERYQAEALIYRHCPVSALLGMVCYTDKVQSEIQRNLAQRQLALPVHVRQEWYF